MHQRLLTLAFVAILVATPAAAHDLQTDTREAQFEFSEDFIA